LCANTIEAALASIADLYSSRGYVFYPVMLRNGKLLAPLLLRPGRLTT